MSTFSLVAAVKWGSLSSVCALAVSRHQLSPVETKAEHRAHSKSPGLNVACSEQPGLFPSLNAMPSSSSTFTEKLLHPRASTSAPSLYCSQTLHESVNRAHFLSHLGSSPGPMGRPGRLSVSLLGFLPFTVHHFHLESYIMRFHPTSAGR